MASVPTPKGQDKERKKPCPVSPQTCQNIILLRGQGKSYRQIEKLTGVSKSEVGRVLKEFQTSKMTIARSTDLSLPSGDTSQKTRHRLRSTVKHAKGPKPPPGPDIPKALPVPKKKPSFEQFMRWYSYPAYKGAHAWQLECHQATYGARYSMINVPREHGKSILMAGEVEFAITFDDYDVLYLGWTDRRKEVAEFIYAYFEMNDMVAVDKRTSMNHFRTTNGGKFDSYLITAKDTLGMHSIGKLERFQNLSVAERNELGDLYEGDEEFNLEVLDEYLKTKSTTRKLWIIIDDPIDETFMDERHKEKTLENRFDSTIYSINPDKFTFTGTRKFEGDFFDFIEAKFSKKLVVYRRGTGLSRMEHAPDPVTNEDKATIVVGTLLCPERYTDPYQPTYKADLRAGKKDLQAIREDIGEYWFCAEWDQDPHPITGDVFETIAYFEAMPSPHDIDLVCMSIDRAETVSATSDYTGFVLIARDFKRNRYLVFDDRTDHWRFDDLLDEINRIYRQFKESTYPFSRIIVVIEKQGGGYSMIQRVEDNPQYAFRDAMIAVAQPGNKAKLPRITDYLRVPVSKGYVEFLSALRKSELLKEVGTFPHGAKVDAIDALATGYNEMVKVDSQMLGEQRVKDLADVLKARIMQRGALQHRSRDERLLLR